MLVLGAAYANVASAEIYLGFGLSQVSIRGDLDGDSAIVGGGAIEILPKVATDSGTKIVVGSRNGRVATEVSLTASSHNGNWIGFETPVDFASLNLDAKLDTSPRRGGAYLLGGIALTTLTVTDGSSDGVIVTDAVYHGFDFRLGLGFEVFFTRHVAIDAQAVYRFGSYSSVDGVFRTSIDGEVNGDGSTLFVGAYYYL